ncbi:serine--tRNA ligase [Gracilaria domingensis]|nr:serine--tRNA ligase [Gracilaria domingensis]
MMIRNHAFVNPALPSFTKVRNTLSSPCAYVNSFLRSTRFCSTRHRLGRPGSGKVIASASIDLKFVKENLPAVTQNIADRSVSADAGLVVQLYDQFVALSIDIGGLRKRRNENAKRMKSAGKMSPDERQKCIAEGKELKAKVAELEIQLVEAEQQLQVEAAKIPNMTHPAVPRGSEENATVISTHGRKRTSETAGITLKSHLELATDLDMVDFENAARVSGNKFYYLRNAGALLELALVNWAMTLAAKHGFTVMTTPDVAREEIVAGCGFQPRGEASQVYRVEDSDLCLVGTAEIPLGGYYAGQILDKQQLPIKMAAFSHCFRREVGAAGSTTRGLYRVHQFSKVEMFILCHPDDSERFHEELRTLEEDMYSSLGLHFKVLDMPSEDLGNPAYRKYDIEAWMPGRGSYGEISSASNCTDYQARRLSIRYKESQGDNRYVHTLNATACAVPRMVIAILETHQQEDGSIRIPEVLRPFMGGMEEIRAEDVHSSVSSREAVPVARRAA